MKAADKTLAKRYARAYMALQGEAFATPLGKVGLDLSVEQGYVAARLTALSMLGAVNDESDAYSTQ